MVRQLYLDLSIKSERSEATTIIRPCLVFFFITQFSSLNFRHSSLITHHFKYYTRLAPSLNFHHSIFFTLFVGHIPFTHCKLFFYPNSLNLVKKKKKKKNQNKPNQWKKKEKKKEKKPRTDRSGKKKKNWTANQEKKSQKLQLGTVCGSPMCV